MLRTCRTLKYDHTDKPVTIIRNTCNEEIMLIMRRRRLAQTPRAFFAMATAGEGATLLGKAPRTARPHHPTPPTVTVVSARLCSSLCLPRFVSVRRCSSLCVSVSLVAPVCRSSSLHDSGCLCSSVCVSTWLCVSLGVSICRYSWLFVSVRLCSYLFVSVRLGSSLFVSVRICSSVLV